MCNQDAAHNTNNSHFYLEQSKIGINYPRALWRPQPSTLLCQGPPNRLHRFFFSGMPTSLSKSDRIINLLIAVAVTEEEEEEGPCDKACRTYVDRHQQSRETKIQQLFNRIRQGDTLNTQIDHKFEQLHQVQEHMVHDIQQLKKHYQDDRTNVDQLLEDQNSTHLRLTTLAIAMEKSERQIRERNLQTFGIYKAEDTTI